MLSFESDYIQGAHQIVLEKLIETNMEPLSGYGDDFYSESAKRKIKRFCNNDNAQVHFLTGGTQTNQVVIDTVLKKYESVVCTDSGHINFHEAGAIEFTGHKIVALNNHLGKIDPLDLDLYMKRYKEDENYLHTTVPKMVYISHPTEYGTLYTLDELKSISDICKQNGLFLYLDGARLGYGLMSSSTDVTIDDISQLCDAFYIGGTKVGALCGEALVFTHNNTPECFFTSIKQHGALLAKGRLLSVQFDALFSDDVYLKISKHAIKMADMIRKALRDKSYEFYIETTTNQIFVVLSDDKYDQLKQSVKLAFWEKIDANKIVVRIATSWATTQSDVNKLISIL